jgi:uncharacterized protein
MRITSLILLLFCLILIDTPVGFGKEFLRFTGGPSGGTFQYFSSGIAIRLSRISPHIRVSNLSSKGSVENIQKVDSGKADFGIAYSGDLYLARHGKLANDTKKYNRVQAVAFLYRAPAQLAVLKSSGIRDLLHLKNKRVALGDAGSGAATSARRFLKLVKLWDQIDRHFLGYTNAANAMKNGEIDAMWILAGYPTRALIELSATQNIDLLHVYPIGAHHGLSQELPFYQPIFIPANTYEGVTHATASFFDSALWIANKEVRPELIHKALTEIYSAEGLAYLVKIKSTARQMSIESGLTGIITPLHEGAKIFWEEQGLKTDPLAKMK